ncbi:MAG TPA: hypothetical protein VNZ22_07105 [Bacillota bacterium]|nr:hypothetical protein [Bacillota bacterium]
MTKLLFILMATATAALLFWQQAVLAQARATSRQLAQQASAAADSVHQTRAETAALKTAWREELARSGDLRQRLAEWDAQPEAVPDVPSSLSPGQRWPTNQPWCYLPKRDLLRYGLPIFTPAGRVSEAAALLFGLSRPQRARVEDAYTDFLEGLQALGCAHLQPIPALAEHGIPDHKLCSYELNLPLDQTTALREQFRAALRATLTETQGELFLQATDRQLSPWLYELSHSRLRLTWAQPPEPKYEGDEGRIAVEFKLPPTRGKPAGESRYLYPDDDDTALAFRHYATLLRAAF